LNGDGITNDLIFLPENTADMKFADIKKGNDVLFSKEQQIEAFDKFVGDNGLEKYRGQILPRNQFLMPWLNRFDVRWTQNLFNNIATERDKLQFTVDIINVGNLFNSKWGVQDAILTNGRAILGKVEKNAVADPTFQMLQYDGKLVTSPFVPASTTATTWSAMIGLRYSF
jgi:hypothetical protein